MRQKLKYRPSPKIPENYGHVFFIRGRIPRATAINLLMGNPRPLNFPPTTPRTSSLPSATLIPKRLRIFGSFIIDQRAVSLLQEFRIAAFFLWTFSFLLFSASYPSLWRRLLKNSGRP